MKEITRTFYLFRLNELTESSKDTAYTEWLKGFVYMDAHDNRVTLTAFAEIFDLNITDWQYDTCGYHYRFAMRSRNFDEDQMKGVRLYTYIMNNYWHLLFQPRIYSKSFPNALKRTSRILFKETDCALTGYCADIYILRPLLEFLRKPDEHISFASLMNNCLDSFFSFCHDDIEYQSSEDAFEQDCEMNGSEFCENGTIFNQTTDN